MSDCAAVEIDRGMLDLLRDDCGSSLEEPVFCELADAAETPWLARTAF